jgi:DNA (cytosine-5)-methyltransferase 1
MFYFRAKFRENDTKMSAIKVLENVDRLLVSPANQRGRDFAIILQSLNQFGYADE